MVWPRMKFRVRTGMLLVALAAGLTLAVIQVREVRASARRKECRSHLQMIGLALQNYAALDGAFPTGTVCNDRLPPEQRLSWLTLVSAYIEQLFWLLDPREPWNAPTNIMTQARGVEGPPSRIGRVALYCCPGAAGSDEEHMPGWTWYVGIAGVGNDAPGLPLGHPRAGVFGYDRATPLSALKDGAANTMLLAETGEANGPWTAGGPSTLRSVDPERRPYVGRGRPFGGLHAGVALVGMADGSVRVLRDSVEPKVVEALATVSGGEPLPAGWDR